MFGRKVRCNVHGVVKAKRTSRGRTRCPVCLKSMQSSLRAINRNYGPREGRCKSMFL
jgi:hypothetical protein